MWISKSWIQGMNNVSDNFGKVSMMFVQKIAILENKVERLEKIIEKYEVNSKPQMEGPKK